MIVPYPFTKVLYLYGAPIVVPRDGDVDKERLQLQQVMNDLEEEANRLVNA